MRPMKQRYQVNLPEHLAKCETNYWQLRRLLPHVMDVDINESWRLIIGNHSTNESMVYFQVLEQSKYTLSLIHI